MLGEPLPLVMGRSGPVGGELLIEPLDAPAPPQVSLGAASRGVPTTDEIFADMGIPAEPAPGTMGTSMGPAAAAAFPGLAKMRVAAERPAEPRPARMAAAAAEGTPVEPAPMPLSPLDAERLRTRGQLSTLYSLLGTPIKQVKVENPKYDIVQRQKSRFYGGGQLEVEPFRPVPFDPSRFPRHEGETEEQYQGRMELFAESDLREQKETYDRQVAEAQAAAQQLGDVRDIGRPGHLGMGEAQLQGAEGVGQAELAQLEDAALAQREAAEASRAATAEAQAADLARRDRARQELEALTHLQGVQAKARERLQALPPLDEQRYFKSMTGGQKFAAIIGAIGGGFGGGVDITRTLGELAERNLATQKANAAQIQDQALAADDAVSRQMGLYQELLQSTGDERTADLMWLQMQHEDAAKMLEARLAETTVPLARAKLQASLVDLRRQIDAQQDEIDLRARTTPEYFMRRYDPLGAKTRAALLKRADKLESFDMDLAKMGIEGAQKRGIEEMKLDAEAAKDERKAEREMYAESASLADKIAPKQALLTSIGDLKREYGDGIPGVGPFAATERIGSWATGVAGGDDRAYKFRKSVENLVERALRDATGAAAPPSEVEKYVDLIMEGSTDIGGEAKVWANLDAFAGNLQNEVDVQARGRSPEAVEYLTRNKALAPGDPMNIGRAPTREVVRRK